MWDSPLDLQLNIARLLIGVQLMQVRRAGQLEFFHLNQHCRFCLLLRLCAGRPPRSPRIFIVSAA